MRPKLPVLLLGLALLAGCGAYPVAPYPATAVYSPSTFDRADDAVLAALGDPGLHISSRDRATGQIVGTRGNASVTASVRAQPGGSTRVEFKTGGEPDPGLRPRMLAAYNPRMGR